MAVALMLEPLGMNAVQAQVKENTVAVLHRGCLSHEVQLPSLRRIWALLYSEQASLTESLQPVCYTTPGFVAAGWSSHCIVCPCMAYPGLDVVCRHELRAYADAGVPNLHVLLRREHCQVGYHVGMH